MRKKGDPTLLERITRVETLLEGVANELKNLSESQNSIKEIINNKFSELSKHVNEQIETMNMRIEKLEKVVAQQRLIIKILGFIAGTTFVGILSIILDLIRKVLFP